MNPILTAPDGGIYKPGMICRRTGQPHPIIVGYPHGGGYYGVECWQKATGQIEPASYRRLLRDRCTPPEFIGGDWQNRVSPEAQYLPRLLGLLWGIGKIEDTPSYCSIAEEVRGYILSRIMPFERAGKALSEGITGLTHIPATKWKADRDIAIADTLAALLLRRDTAFRLAWLRQDVLLNSRDERGDWDKICSLMSWLHEKPLTDKQEHLVFALEVNYEHGTRL